MGVRQGGLLLEEGAGLLHNRGGLAEHYGMARQAEDKIGQASRGEHLDDVWGGAMTVPADEERGWDQGRRREDRSRTKDPSTAWRKSHTLYTLSGLRP